MPQVKPRFFKVFNECPKIVVGSEPVSNGTNPSITVTRKAHESEPDMNVLVIASSGIAAGIATSIEVYVRSMYITGTSERTYESKFTKSDWPKIVWKGKLSSAGTLTLAVPNIVDVELGARK